MLYKNRMTSIADKVKIARANSTAVFRMDQLSAIDVSFGYNEGV